MPTDGIYLNNYIGSEKIEIFSRFLFEVASFNKKKLKQGNIEEVRNSDTDQWEDK